MGSTWHCGGCMLGVVWVERCPALRPAAPLCPRVTCTSRGVGQQGLPVATWTTARSLRSGGGDHLGQELPLSPHVISSRRAGVRAGGGVPCGPAPRPWPQPRPPLSVLASLPLKMAFLLM